MTREERRRQATAAITLCERIGHRLKAQGDVAAIPDAQLERMFTGVELRAAQWLRHVASLCAQPKRKKAVEETNEDMLIEEDSDAT